MQHMFHMALTPPTCLAFSTKLVFNIQLEITVASHMSNLSFQSILHINKENKNSIKSKSPNLNTNVIIH